MPIWDEAKRRSNLAKHGVDFAIVDRFDFVTAIIEEDVSEPYGEQRQIATGRIDDTLYVYVYTLRGDDDHAISLRRATLREKRRYAEKK